MIKIILGIISSLIGIYIFLYTNKRDIVSKHKNSLFYKIFDYTDHIIEKIIKYSVPGITKTNNNANKNSLNDLHQYLDIDEIISIKDSTYISFSFENKLKKNEIMSLESKIRNVLMFITMLPIIIMALWVATYIFQSIDGIGEEDIKRITTIIVLVSLTWMVAFIIFHTKLISLYQNKDSFLFDLIALSSPNVISITMNSDMISIRGYWNNFIAKTNDYAIFNYDGDDFQNGIYLKTKNDKIWVFRYPRFYSDTLFSSVELEQLTNKLNLLLEKYKSNK